MSGAFTKDREILREWGARYAEIAALPIQAEKQRLWRRLNGLRPERPMVAIDQVCWNEFERVFPDELTLQCADPDARRHEQYLRRTVFQWRHFPGDMVVEPFLAVEKSFINTGFGIAIREKTVPTDRTNDVVAHHYENQLERDEDLEKVRQPCVRINSEETERRLNQAREWFDGVLEVRSVGVTPYLSIWDVISMWMGVEGALYALVDRPEFMHRLCERMTSGYLSMLDQMEAQGLLYGPQPVIHCTGAWTDDLPAPGYDPARPRTRDMWMFGLAQMFSTVSPAMFKEFEVEYTRRLCERFGLVYYGCCDPLDGKMAEVRELPHVRKVSMSPWVNQERGAEEIGRDFVFSRKPNPALLATEKFDEDVIRRDLRETIRICAKYGCPLELIQKDISTVRNEPQRLFAWSRIALEEVGA